jgi:drug/metabolite transporter (DMT)-like permease
MTRYGPHAQRNGVLMGALAALLFSIGGVAQKTLMHNALEALDFAPIRVLISALLLVFFLAARDRSAFRIARRDLPRLAVYGAGLMLTTQLLYSTSIAHLPIAIGTLLVYVSIANLALYNRLRHGTELGAGGRFSVGLALLGALFITGVVSGRVSGNLDAIGLAAGFANSVVFAAYLLVGGRLQRSRTAPSLLMWAMVFATVGWSVLRPWWNFPWDVMLTSSPLLVDHGPVLPVWLLVAYVALVGTVLPFGLVLASVARIGAQRSSIVSASEPLFAAVIALLLIGELLDGWQLIGGALIVSAIVVGEAYAMRAHRHDEADAKAT